MEELKEERNRPPKLIVFINNDVYEGEKRSVGIYTFIHILCFNNYSKCY